MQIISYLMLRLLSRSWIIDDLNILLFYLFLKILGSSSYTASNYLIPNLTVDYFSFSANILFSFYLIFASRRDWKSLPGFNASNGLIFPQLWDRIASNLFLLLNSSTISSFFSISYLLMKGKTCNGILIFLFFPNPSF